jgi:hypothetical protein
LWFVAIGEERPARAVLDVLVEAHGVSVDALVLKSPETNPLAEFARRHNVSVVPSAPFEQLESVGIMKVLLADLRDNARQEFRAGSKAAA